ncbi:uncharacterized protein LOC123518346 isoform X1 [Portunus trituberculatus]|uniref:uncharacterized protein LOC123518346 isoform X1 n=1 Tax=Portunus trituberculatus TaxID=210409 RepID=UPI001E1CB09C|nr:uncharacterized protein LOC123518346 isoform X1 [Portunus trituberculatus]
MAPRLLTSTLLLLVCAGTGTHGYLCDDALTNCLGVGYYNKCHDFCDTQYFTCEEIGGPGVLSTCPYGLVFNTDPAGSNKCVLYENCFFSNAGCDDSVVPVCQTTFELIPKCRDCQNTFFICDGTNAAAIPGTCGAGLVFNPIPSHPACIPEDLCPCTEPPC